MIPATTDLYDEAVCEALGINRADPRAIDVLERVGPMPAGKLAQQAGLSPGAMTASIDRLEEAGYARRVRDPDDRRRITIEPTPLTRKRARELCGPMKKAYDAAVADYTLEQLETIRDYWRRGVEVGEAQLARLRGETGSKVA
jgi:DNA-binding MarR family transcriptional regulator